MPCAIWSWGSGAGEVVPANGTFFFYAKIAEWESWYAGNVKRFTFYRIYNGRGQYTRCRRHSLGMAKKVREDVADLLLNERVTVVLGCGFLEVYLLLFRLSGCIIQVRYK